MQIFPRSLNRLPVIAAVATALLGGGITFVFWYYFTPKNFQVGYMPTQPVPYSHRLHAGELGLDCRYCHANVERSAVAMVPPTQTCMNCHSLVKTDSAKLQPIRDSWKTGKPMEWVRIHKIPEHAYFNHSAHVNAGVGCVSCHGRIDQMEVVRQEQPLSMGWCLECHRNPEPNLRPKDQITNMEWQDDPSHPFKKPKICDTSQTTGAGVFAVAAKNLEDRQICAPQNCSGCHR
jgi:hypothetical protein